MTDYPTANAFSSASDDLTRLSPRDPREMPLFTGCLIFSLLVWAPIVVVLLLTALRQPASVVLMLICAGIVVFISVAVRAALVTQVRGNGLMVGPDQLAGLHEVVQKVGAKLGIPMPEVYVVQLGGLQETITKIFLGRRILVLSDRVLDDYGAGPELEMVVGRELAHFRFRHIVWRFWLLPSAILPLLYPAWSRAAEYTADRCGLLACGDFAAAERAMYIAAAGGKLGRDVCRESYYRQISESGGFWMTLAHLLSGEPSITYRVSRLLEAVPGQGLQPPVPQTSVLGAILCAFVPGVVGVRGERAGSFTGLLVSIAVIALLISILLPSLLRARELAKRSVCAANLRYVAPPLARHLRTNQNKLPDWNALVKSGRLTPGVLQCPNAERPNYMYIPESGTSNDTIRPVIFEPLDNHQDGGTVLFSNGNVEFVPQPRYEEILAPYLDRAIPIAIESGEPPELGYREY